MRQIVRITRFYWENGLNCVIFLQEFRHSLERSLYFQGICLKSCWKPLLTPRLNGVFDLSLSINLHELSAEKTNEKAIAGKTSGLIGLDEWVTWRARHFGIYQKLTVKITKLERPLMFEDKMLKGAFQKWSIFIFLKAPEQVR